MDYNTFWCVPSTRRTRRSLQDKVKLAYALSFYLKLGGLPDEEKLLTYATYPRPGGGRATVNSMSDCQKHTLYY